MKEEEIIKNKEDLLRKKDYYYPFIKLTEDEIIEFNDLCLRYNIDLKAIPKDQYNALKDKEVSLIDINQNNKNNNFIIPNQLIDQENNININIKENDDNKFSNKKRYINKKHQKKKKNSNDYYSIYFKKIIDSNRIIIEDKLRRPKLIQEIQEKVKFLTPNILRDIGEKKHIKIIGNNFSEYELQQKSINQLDDIIGDIEFNKNIYQLESRREKTIKSILDNELRLQQKYEDKFKKKSEIEENKIEENKSEENMIDENSRQKEEEKSNVVARKEINESESEEDSYDGTLN